LGFLASTQSTGKGLLIMQYRRAKTPGGTFFFTVVTYRRRKFLCVPENIILLRQAFREVMSEHPFKIDAAVVLPDHLHCLWTLPHQDEDFSTRWRLIKSHFTRHCEKMYQGVVSASRQHKQERAVWQRRFWEHQIRDETDFIHHVEYIHYNPVKHGLVNAPIEWEYSSFHKYVKRGQYPADWGAGAPITFPPGVGHE
jgi:putative transposase